MKEDFHKLKQEEYCRSMIEQMLSIIDYNIMMETLEDPEAESEEQNNE